MKIAINNLFFVAGIFLVITLQPGKGGTADDMSAQTSRNVSTIDTLMDLVRNMFPPNLVQACIEQYRTVPRKQENSTSGNFLSLKFSLKDKSTLCTIH